MLDKAGLNLPWLGPMYLTVIRTLFINVPGNINLACLPLCECVTYHNNYWQLLNITFKTLMDVLVCILINNSVGVFCCKFFFSLTIRRLIQKYYKVLYINQRDMNGTLLYTHIRRRDKNARKNIMNRAYVESFTVICHRPNRYFTLYAFDTFFPS